MNNYTFMNLSQLPLTWAELFYKLSEGDGTCDWTFGMCGAYRGQGQL